MCLLLDGTIVDKTRIVTSAVTWFILYLVGETDGGHSMLDTWMSELL